MAEYEIKLDKKTSNIQLRKIEKDITIQLRKRANTIELKQVGRKGEKGEKGDKGDKGEKGDPATNLVTSVNGKQGVVVLTATDVNADTTGSAAQALSDANNYTDQEVSNINTGVLSVAAGTNVTIDNTDPKNPVVSSTGGGAVDSVNGKTGVVVLDADDIDDTSTTHKFATASQLSNADSAIQPSDLAAVATTGDYDDLSNKPSIPANLSDLSGDSDDISEGSTNLYMTSSERSKLSGIEAGAEVNTVDSVAGKTGAVTLGKSDVGLGNVDNTSDANKPISTATQSALDDKADDTTLIAALPSTIGSNNQVLKVVSGNPTWATDANTTYAIPSQAEAETGTATNARAFSAQRVNQAIQSLAPVKPADLALKGVLAYDEYTANGTWTKPAGAKVVEVFVIGGGGGGGKASTGAEGTARDGGGGGGAGGAVIGQFNADDLDATVAITIGAGGAGGTADGGFNTGGAGGTTSFGTYVQAGGGAGGSSGGMTLDSPNTASGGAAGASSLLVGPGGAGLSGAGVLFGSPGFSGHIGSGGAGSSRVASNTNNLGLEGGNSSAGAGGLRGGNADPGGNGVDGSATNGGSGGGGGAKGQPGGNGGFPGGGGGGGGANRTDDGAGGNGGSGGAGKAIVITYG